MDDYDVINKYKDDLQQQHLYNWVEYTNDINNKLMNMWNFIMYNDFTNNEVNRLHKELENKEQMINDIDKDYMSLLKKVSKLESKIKELEDDTNNGEPSNKRPKIKLIKLDLIKEEYNKFKKDNKYKFVSKPIRNKKLKNLFSNLNSIYDIIELENHKNKFDFMDNDKFVKIYNIIPSLKELGGIIGMENVKDTIFKKICYFVHGLHNDNELNNVMIMGDPGMGKTTVAKILGKIYLGLGFLDNDKFMTATRADLVAKYLGQTAIKTQKAIDSIEGGVMFIDEIYSLGNEEKRDSFAKEAIDTINLNMTNGKKWLLIVAGYKEDIYKCFLSYNKGLERRFTVKLEIEKYTDEELYKILLKFIKDDGWEIEKNCQDLITSNYTYFKFFGGDIQKIFQLAKEFYSLRLMKECNFINNNKKKKPILSKIDIINSIDSFKENIEDNKIDTHVLHSMYL